MEVQSFVHRLAQFLTSWEATTFLIGEYVEEEIRDNPLFTMVDGIFWLSQVTERNSVVRKLQVMKIARPGIGAGTAHRPHRATTGCKPSRARWDWSATRQNPRGIGVFLSAFPNWTR